MPSKNKINANKPPDPPDKLVISPGLLKETLASELTIFEELIREEVAKKTEEAIADLKNELKKRDKEIEKLKEDVLELAKAKPSFSKVATMKEAYERKNTILAPEITVLPVPPSLTRTSSFTGARQRTPIRREEATRSLPEGKEDIVRQFKLSKTKIGIYPVSLEDIQAMNTILTSDVMRPTSEELAFGEKCEPARIACADDFFQKELNILPHQYSIVRCDYQKNLERMTM